MGRSISEETFRKEERKERSIIELDREFQKVGYRYLGVYPDFLGNKPMLCEGKHPFKPIRDLGIREARKILKGM